MCFVYSLLIPPTAFCDCRTQDFKFPKNFEIQCNAKPSMFAYPKKLEEKKEEKKKRVETVTLSTTAKNKARLARKKAKEGGDKEDSAMDVDKEEGDSDKEKDEAEKEKSGADEEKSEDEKAKEGEAESMDVEGEESPEKPVKKKREPEPTSFRVTNPSRITLAQSDYCEFDLNQRYRPIRPEEKPFGVIILTDSTPNEEEDVGAVQAPSLEPEGECAPPEPFEWTPPDHADASGSGNAAEETSPAAEPMEEDDKKEEESKK